jgi:Flp pilus assembly protein TadG
MTPARGQALLELALCAPVVVLLTLGTVATAQVAAARMGLESATQAAADAAARAPDVATASASAHDRFEAVVNGYPVRSATVVISVGDFGRSGHVTASSSASVDIAWAAYLSLPSQLTLRAQVTVPLEEWRSHNT